MTNDQTKLLSPECIQGLLRDKGWQQRDVATYFNRREEWVSRIINNSNNCRSVMHDCMFLGLPDRNAAPTNFTAASPEDIKNLLRIKGWHQNELAQFLGRRDEWVNRLVNNSDNCRGAMHDCLFFGLPFKEKQ